MTYAKNYGFGPAGLTTESIDLTLPTSGPFAASTIDVTLVRIETEPGVSIITMLAQAIDETGNSASEEIYIDATLVPTRFRATTDTRWVGINTTQSGIHDFGWFNVAAAVSWRFWRTPNNSKWATAGQVKVWPFHATWIGS